MNFSTNSLQFSGKKVELIQLNWIESNNKIKLDWINTSMFRFFFNFTKMVHIKTKNIIFRIILNLNSNQFIRIYFDWGELQLKHNLKWNWTHQISSNKLNQWRKLYTSIHIFGMNLNVQLNSAKNNPFCTLLPKTKVRKINKKLKLYLWRNLKW